MRRAEVRATDGSGAVTTLGIPTTLRPFAPYMPTTKDLLPEHRQFLLDGTRTGKLGYTAADGRPLVAPVWFTIDGEDLVFTTFTENAKARAMRRDPRVVLLVDLEQPPYAFVQVQGTAELVDDVSESRRISTIVGGRYMGAERAEEFGKRNGVPGELTIRIRPTKVVANLNVSG
jgi:PPOX class probable F420-dependent enzyme